MTGDKRTQVGQWVSHGVFLVAFEKDRIYLGSFDGAVVEWFYAQYHGLVRRNSNIWNRRAGPGFHVVKPLPHLNGNYFGGYLIFGDGATGSGTFSVVSNNGRHYEGAWVSRGVVAVRFEGGLLRLASFDGCKLDFFFDSSYTATAPYMHIVPVQNRDRWFKRSDHAFEVCAGTASQCQTMDIVSV
eukprot:CAMPEP_0184659004 /NCGR_PEP_ID=MMETSP0308-20130426/27739_1 /TAXON_ID=38269 /ORGANISM="Gloeochaete witrockiana, Strain SAG 46.84" /LENGTH=184 /DNA_ID=CAMNT_0027098437 /DNA_START=265 /DNA_END=819 /DNA_ORIENTATION=-